MAGPISSEDAEKLWQYKMHEEDIFYQRLNFFLVAESMLFVAYTTLFASPRSIFSVIIVLSTLGSILTLVWIYVSSRQLNVMRQIAKESQEAVNVYARIREERSKWPVSSTKLLAYFVPLVVLLAWLTIVITTVNTQRVAKSPPALSKMQPVLHKPDAKQNDRGL
jgi:small-conductance mechanosensitive channel